MGKSIKVSVGYAWQKDSSNEKTKPVNEDALWQSIRTRFAGVCKTVGKKNNLNVSLSRLRATVGDFILPSIMRKIEHSDVLIFDLTKADYVLSTEKDGSIRNGINQNVILELGAALALKKHIILMCSSAVKIPTDLSGLYVAKYRAEESDGKIQRNFEDEKGLTTAFVGMLRKTIKKNNECAKEAC